MTGQILTILSHVVHGYVGNRAMTFPLQYMGWNVDALNTTNLSNHPGYGKFCGKTEDGGLIDKILHGLDDIGNGVNHYDMVITGYLPTLDIITAVETMFNKLDRSNDKKPLIVMDPILGDNGKLYLLEAVVPVYKRILSSGMVDLITPNQFEFEYLTDTTITDEASLQQAIIKFRSLYNVNHLVISSVNFASTMYAVGSCQQQDKVILIPITEIPVKFFGCGDLFTALMAHNFTHHDFETSLQDAVVKLSTILLNTVRLTVGASKMIKDLKIIQLRDILLQTFTLEVKYLQLD